MAWPVVTPTSQALVVEVTAPAARALRLGPGLGVGMTVQFLPSKCSGRGWLEGSGGGGLATWVQVRPSQCSRRAWVPLPEALAEPTAQAFWGVRAVIPDRSVRVPGLGLGTRVHALPFQCRMKVAAAPLAVVPAAQASVGEVAA